MKSVLRTLLAGSVGVAMATLAVVTPASAHVDGSSMESNAITTVTLNVEHGCGELDLTGLRVQLPEGASEVTAEYPANWTSTITPTEITWVGGPQPAHEELPFTFRLRLTQPSGTIVRFPTIELCDGGEIAWIASTPEGGSESDRPAPQITVGGSGSMAQMSMDSTDATMRTGSTPTMAPEQTPITESGSETHNAGLVVLLIVSAIIGGGALILYLRNRRPRTGN
jgi:uncharacterized protein YcnI